MKKKKKMKLGFKPDGNVFGQVLQNGTGPDVIPYGRNLVDVTRFSAKDGHYPNHVLQRIQVVKALLCSRVDVCILELVL